MIPPSLVHFWDDPLYRFITLIIAVELVFVLLQIGWLLLQSLRSKYHEIQTRRFHNKMKTDFFNILQGSEAEEEWLKKARRYPKAVIREFLESFLQTADGNYRTTILNLYRQLGLVKKDLRDLRSVFWHRRVWALRRLYNAASEKEKFALSRKSQDIHTIRILAAQIVARVGTAKDLYELLKGQRVYNRLMEQPVFAMFTDMEREKFIELIKRWDKFECSFLKRILLIVAAKKAPESIGGWLESAANDPDMDVRIGASIAAGTMHTSQSLLLLMRLLKDPEWEVRAQAAKGLGLHQEGSSIHLLARALSDSSYWVRQNAAAALSSMSSEARERLAAIAAEREDRFAADAARQELERFQLLISAEGVQS